MGGEWSKAVKMIFNKKYSNGRGKLVDAMKDPETKAIHSSMLEKKPMKMETKMNKNVNNKMNKMNKTQKFKKKMRGGTYNPEYIQNALDDIESRLNALEGQTETPVANEKDDEEDDEEDEEGEEESEEKRKLREEAEANDYGRPPPRLHKSPAGPPAADTSDVSDKRGGKRSKKNISNKKDKKGKSFRKKCGW